MRCPLESSNCTHGKRWPPWTVPAGPRLSGLFGYLICVCETVLNISRRTAVNRNRNGRNQGTMRSPHLRCNGAASIYEGERTVGCGYQTTSESNPLRLVRFQQRRRRSALDYSGQFPGQINGIADASVHSLATHWAMDVSSVPQVKKHWRSENAPQLDDARDSWRTTLLQRRSALDGE